MAISFKVKFDETAGLNAAMESAKKVFMEDQKKKIQHLFPEIERQGGAVSFNETGGIIITGIDDEFTAKVTEALL